MKQELFIYIDPGYLENAGHYNSFARNIRTALVKRGVEEWHFVNDDVSKATLREFKLERLFQYRAIMKEMTSNVVPYSPLKLKALTFAKKVIDPIRREVKKRKIHFPLSYPTALEERSFLKSHQDTILNAFSEALDVIVKRIVALGYEDRKVSLFMYTSHPLYFPIFAKVLANKQYAHLDITAHCSLFYLNPQFCRKEQIPEYVQLLKSVSNLLEWSDPHEKLRLYADSERTIALYAPYFTRPLRLLPIALDNKPLTTQTKNNIAASSVTIGYLGYPSVKQGYPLAKQLYEKITAQKEYANVRFVVRHKTHFATPDMKGTISDFMRETARIEHLTGYLSQKEYEGLIARCDIMVLPHSREDYPVQTSGLFIDCLLRRKIVVVPENTWMADRLRQYGSGRTFISNDIASFVDAVKDVIDNIETYRKSAGRNIEEFAKLHTAETLLDRLEVGIPTPEIPVMTTVGIDEKEIKPSPPKKDYSIMDTNLARFKNLFKGQRCFVTGNGPSLNKMDLSKLEGEYVFCANAFYLMFPKISWRPQFYVTVDTRVLPDRAREIVSMHEQHPGMVLFFPKELLNHQTKETASTDTVIPPARNRLFFTQKELLLDKLPYSAFSMEADHYLVQPYTVSITALQLAIFMGFDPIYLIGCDTQYTIPASVLAEGEETENGKMFLTSTADDDPNHFVPNYFGKGHRWHNPQVENMIWHYKMAHETTAIHGRHIFNATVGGQLEVFPRVNFDEVCG